MSCSRARLTRVTTRWITEVREPFAGIQGQCVLTAMAEFVKTIAEN